MREEIPVRIFKAHSARRCFCPINAGNEVWRNDLQRYVKINEIILKIDKDGLVKTTCPETINAIKTRYRTKFLIPKYRINQETQINERDGFENKINEVYLPLGTYATKEEHKKAVEKHIQLGSYDFIPEEDIERAMNDAKKEKMKLDLIELKKENELRKSKILEEKKKQLKKGK